MLQAAGVSGSLGKVPSTSEDVVHIVSLKMTHKCISISYLNFLKLMDAIIIKYLKKHMVQLQVTEIPAPKIGVIGAFHLRHSLIYYVNLH